METVFSSAYCVLAASSASNQRDGFLKTNLAQGTERARRDRAVVTIQPKDKPALYVCEMVDDFDGHVLKGGLNQRAWVLQERALARRTVYFAEPQTYWECGMGVRCETMTRMKNKLASFLGDPAFPSLALSGNRGEEIRWYQELYAQYSRLGLSHDVDRPIAIRGLESRLITAFEKKYPAFEGAHGVLADGPTGGLLHRSLLWRRGMKKGDKRVLEHIHFPSGHGGAPTWSWMAFRGGIDFIQVEGSTVDWLPLELYPLRRMDGEAFTPKLREKGTPLRPTMVIARAREFTSAVHLRGGGRDTLTNVTYDAPGTTTAGRVFKCVIVGREKGEEGKDGKAKVHFVLIVTPTPRRGGMGASRDLKTYKRVGAGSMLGRSILGLDGEGEEVVII